MIISYDPSGNLRWDQFKDGDAGVEGPNCSDYARDLLVLDPCYTEPCRVFVTGQLCQEMGNQDYGTAKLRCSDGEELAQSIDQFIKYAT